MIERITLTQTRAQVGKKWLLETAQVGEGELGRGGERESSV